MPEFAGTSGVTARRPYGLAGLLTLGCLTWIRTSLAWALFVSLREGFDLADLDGPLPLMIVLLLTAGGFLGLLVTGCFIACHPAGITGSRRSAFRGLLFGIAPSVILVLLAVALGVEADCCGASSGFYLFNLGLFVALPLGMIAGPWMGVRLAPRLQANGWVRSGCPQRWMRAAQG